MNEEKEKQQIQEQKEREEQEEATKKRKEEALRKPKDAPEKKQEPVKKSPLEEARDIDASIKAGNAELKKLLEKQEQLLADTALAGKGFAGMPATKPVEMTDTEYAEALERGEVNPLKEDGLI